MKQWNQTVRQIETLIAAGKPLVIVSGEGEQGTVEAYTGPMTAQAIRARLTKERAGGGRWARVDTDDGMAVMGAVGNDSPTNDYIIKSIPSDLWREVKAAAAMQGTTIREMILQALREIVKKKTLLQSELEKSTI
jgi:hypothetical protein